MIQHFTTTTIPVIHKAAEDGVHQYGETWIMIETRPPINSASPATISWQTPDTSHTSGSIRGAGGTLNWPNYAGTHPMSRSASAATTRKSAMSSVRLESAFAPGSRWDPNSTRRMRLIGWWHFQLVLVLHGTHKTSGKREAHYSSLNKSRHAVTVKTIQLCNPRHLVGCCDILPLQKKHCLDAIVSTHQPEIHIVQQPVIAPVPSQFNHKPRQGVAVSTQVEIRFLAGIRVGPVDESNGYSNQ